MELDCNDENLGDIITWVSSFVSPKKLGLLYGLVSTSKMRLELRKSVPISLSDSVGYSNPSSLAPTAVRIADLNLPNIILQSFVPVF